MTVTPLAYDGEGRVYEGDGFCFSPENKLEVEALVNLDNYYGEIICFVKALTDDDTMISVTSSLDGEERVEYIGGSQLHLWYTERGVATYTMYLTNEAGDLLSNLVELTVDTTQRDLSFDFNMNYHNPDDLGLSFNPDGSMNVYVDTGFECEDMTVGYYVAVGQYFYRGRENTAIIRNIPSGYHGYSHYVYAEIEGVKYVVGFSSPSGSITPSIADIGCSFDESRVEITLPSDGSVYLDTVRLVTSDGREMLLVAESFVLDEDTGRYVTTFDLGTLPEELVICVTAERDGAKLDFLDEYDGSLVTEEKITFYP